MKKSEQKEIITDTIEAYAEAIANDVQDLLDSIASCNGCFDYDKYTKEAKVLLGQFLDIIDMNLKIKEKECKAIYRSK